MKNYFKNIGQNLLALGFRLDQSSLLMKKASFLLQRDRDSYKILGKYIFVINIFKDEVLLYEALRLACHIHVIYLSYTCHIHVLLVISARVKLAECIGNLAAKYKKCKFKVRKSLEMSKPALWLDSCRCWRTPGM